MNTCYNENMEINQKKYEQVILYLCSKLGNEIRGKKRLAKLLYYVDFDFFEKYNVSITGDTYRALPMGPFPLGMEKIVKEMVEKGTIEYTKIEEHDGYRPTEIIRCLTKPDNSQFTKDEIFILDRVAQKYGALNGKQLEDLTHAEAPYLGTKPQNDIAYELSFYRDTDFEGND